MFEFTLVRQTPVTVNYDFNRDGKLEYGDDTAPEETAIINAAGTNVPRNIFLVGSITGIYKGFAAIGGVYVYVGQGATAQTIAHELGHAAFSLPHTSEADAAGVLLPSNSVDLENIMHPIIGDGWRLRHGQWNLVNP